MSRFIVFLLLLFVSCDINNSKTDILDDVRSAKSKWDSVNPQNYSYQYQTICYCFFTETVRVIVRSDSVIDVQNIGTSETIMVDLNGTRIPFHEYAKSSFFTINDFFARILVQIPVADESTADFADKNGMPIQVSFDHIIEAVDDEITYNFSELQIN